MAYDYNLFLDSLKSTLVSNATSLYASLTVNYPTITTDNIQIGDPKNLARSADRYPFIVINYKSKEEEFTQLGVSNSGIARDIVNNLDIHAFIQVGSDSQDSDVQSRTLARNLETVLRANYTKAGSDGWDTALVDTAIFDNAYEEGNNTYVSSARLECSFKKYSIT